MPTLSAQEGSRLLYEEPENAFVAQFIGENNRLLGTVEETDGDRCSVRLGDGSLIRALGIRVAAAGRHCANAFDARVEELVYLCDRSRIRPALAPTIPLHCSDDFLVQCRDLAREYDVCLQTHLAESKVQAVLGLKRYGTTLTAHLDDLGLLGPRFSAAHAIWLDNDDVRRIADAGASVVHNPLSNMQFGSGLAAVGRMIAAGVNVGVGTDAVNSADSLNMFEATRLASFISRVHTFESADWLSPDRVLAMATAGGARAMVLDEGHLTTVDEKKLRAAVEAARERLGAATASRCAFAEKLEDYVGAFCATQARTPYHVHRHLGDAPGGF